jgi:hypothetical protein
MPKSQLKHVRIRWFFLAERGERLVEQRASKEEESNGMEIVVDGATQL